MKIRKSDTLSPTRNPVSGNSTELDWWSALLKAKDWDYEYSEDDEEEERLAGLSDKEREEEEIDDLLDAAYSGGDVGYISDLAGLSQEETEAAIDEFLGPDVIGESFEKLTGRSIEDAVRFQTGGMYDYREQLGPEDKVKAEKYFMNLGAVWANDENQVPKAIHEILIATFLLGAHSPGLYRPTLSGEEERVETGGVDKDGQPITEVVKPKGRSGVRSPISKNANNSGNLLKRFLSLTHSMYTMSTGGEREEGEHIAGTNVPRKFWQHDNYLNGVLSRVVGRNLRASKRNAGPEQVAEVINTMEDDDKWALLEEERSKLLQYAEASLDHVCRGEAFTPEMLVTSLTDKYNTALRTGRMSGPGTGGLTVLNMMDMQAETQGHYDELEVIERELRESEEDDSNLQPNVTEVEASPDTLELRAKKEELESQIREKELDYRDYLRENRNTLFNILGDLFTQLDRDIIQPAARLKDQSRSFSERRLLRSSLEDGLVPNVGASMHSGDSGVGAKNYHLTMFDRRNYDEGGPFNVRNLLDSKGQCAIQFAHDNNITNLLRSDAWQKLFDKLNSLGYYEGGLGVDREPADEEVASVLLEDFLEKEFPLNRDIVNSIITSYKSRIVAGDDKSSCSCLECKDGDPKPYLHRGLGNTPHRFWHPNHDSLFLTSISPPNSPSQRHIDRAIKRADMKRIGADARQQIKDNKREKRELEGKLLGAEEEGLSPGEIQKLGAEIAKLEDEIQHLNTTVENKVVITGDKAEQVRNMTDYVERDWGFSDKTPLPPAVLEQMKELEEETGGEFQRVTSRDKGLASVRMPKGREKRNHAIMCSPLTEDNAKYLPQDGDTEDYTSEIATAHDTIDALRSVLEYHEEAEERGLPPKFVKWLKKTKDVADRVKAMKAALADVSVARNMDPNSLVDSMDLLGGPSGAEIQQLTAAWNKLWNETHSNRFKELNARYEQWKEDEEKLASEKGTWNVDTEEWEGRAEDYDERVQELSMRNREIWAFHRELEDAWNNLGYGPRLLEETELKDLAQQIRELNKGNFPEPVNEYTWGKNFLAFAKKVGMKPDDLYSELTSEGGVLDVQSRGLALAVGWSDIVTSPPERKASVIMPIPRQDEFVGPASKHTRSLDEFGRVLPQAQGYPRQDLLRGRFRDFRKYPPGTPPPISDEPASQLNEPGAYNTWGLGQVYRKEVETGEVDKDGQPITKIIEIPWDNSDGPNHKNQRKMALGKGPNSRYGKPSSWRFLGMDGRSSRRPAFPFTRPSVNEQGKRIRIEGAENPIRGKKGKITFNIKSLTKIASQTEQYAKVLSNRTLAGLGTPSMDSLGRLHPYEMFPVISNAMRWGLHHHIDANPDLDDKAKEQEKWLLDWVLGGYKEWTEYPIPVFTWGMKDMYGERISSVEDLLKHYDDDWAQVVAEIERRMFRYNMDEGNGIAIVNGKQVKVSNLDPASIDPTTGAEQHETYDTDTYALLKKIQFNTLDAICSPELFTRRLNAIIGTGMRSYEDEEGQTVTEKVLDYNQQDLSNPSGSRNRCTVKQCAGRGYINFEDAKNNLIFSGELPPGTSDLDALDMIIDKYGHFGDKENWEEQQQAEARLWGKAYQPVPQELRIKCYGCDGLGVCGGCGGTGAEYIPPTMNVQFLSMLDQITGFDRAQAIEDVYGVSGFEGTLNQFFEEHPDCDPGNEEYTVPKSLLDPTVSPVPPSTQPVSDPKSLIAARAALKQADGKDEILSRSTNTLYDDTEKEQIADEVSRLNGEITEFKESLETVIGLPDESFGGPDKKQEIIRTLLSNIEKCSNDKLMLTSEYNFAEANFNWAASHGFGGVGSDRVPSLGGREPLEREYGAITPQQYEDLSEELRELYVFQKGRKTLSGKRPDRYILRDFEYREDPNWLSAQRQLMEESRKLSPTKVWGSSLAHPHQYGVTIPVYREMERLEEEHQEWLDSNKNATHMEKLLQKVKLQTELDSIEADEEGSYEWDLSDHDKEIQSWLADEENGPRPLPDGKISLQDLKDFCGGGYTLANGMSALGTIDVIGKGPNGGYSNYKLIVPLVGNTPYSSIKGALDIHQEGGLGITKLGNKRPFTDAELDDIEERIEAINILRDRAQQAMAPVYELMENSGLTLDDLLTGGEGGEGMGNEELTKLLEKYVEPHDNGEPRSLVDILAHDPLVHEVRIMGPPTDWVKKYHDLTSRLAQLRKQPKKNAEEIERVNAEKQEHLSLVSEFREEGSVPTSIIGGGMLYPDSIAFRDDHARDLLESYGWQLVTDSSGQKDVIRIPGFRGGDTEYTDCFEAKILPAKLSNEDLIHIMGSLLHPGRFHMADKLVIEEGEYGPETFWVLNPLEQTSPIIDTQLGKLRKKLWKHFDYLADNEPDAFMRCIIPEWVDDSKVHSEIYITPGNTGLDMDTIVQYLHRIRERWPGFDLAGLNCQPRAYAEMTPLRSEHDIARLIEHESDYADIIKGMKEDIETQKKLIADHEANRFKVDSDETGTISRDEWDALAAQYPKLSRAQFESLDEGEKYPEEHGLGYDPEEYDEYLSSRGERQTLSGGAHSSWQVKNIRLRENLKAQEEEYRRTKQQQKDDSQKLRDISGHSVLRSNTLWWGDGSRAFHAEQWRDKALSSVAHYLQWATDSDDETLSNLMDVISTLPESDLEGWGIQPDLGGVGSLDPPSDRFGKMMSHADYRAFDLPVPSTPRQSGHRFPLFGEMRTGEFDEGPAASFKEPDPLTGDYGYEEGGGSVYDSDVIRQAREIDSRIRELDRMIEFGTTKRSRDSMSIERNQLLDAKAYLVGMQKEQQGGMMRGGGSPDEYRTGARVSHWNTDLLAHHNSVLDEEEPENELDKVKYFERQRKSREWLDRREKRRKSNKIAMIMGQVRERTALGWDIDIPEDAAEETHARDALPGLPEDAFDEGKRISQGWDTSSGFQGSRKPFQGPGVIEPPDDDQVQASSDPLEIAWDTLLKNITLL